MSKSVDEKIRCTPEERDSWAAAAAELGVSRAEFIRRAANRAADLTPVAPAREFVAGEPQPTAIENEFTKAELLEMPRDQFEAQTRRCPHGRRGPSAGEWCPVCDR